MADLKIEVGNVYCYMTLPNSCQIIGQHIYNLCSAYAKGYQFSKAYKHKHWDGKIHFCKYSHPHLRFATGLLAFVYDFLKKNDISVVLEDKRTITGVKVPFKYKGKLYDYQEDAVKLCVKAERGLTDLAPAAGKTEIFMGLIAKLQVPTLVIVHTTELLLQSCERILDKLNVKKVGVIGMGTEDVEYLTVATIQSLLRMLNENPKHFTEVVNKFDCVIVDEAHHCNADAKSFAKVIESIPARYRYGFTATKYSDLKKKVSAQDLGLNAYLGTTIFTMNWLELKQKGRLADVEIHMLDYYHEFGAEDMEPFLLDEGGNKRSPTSIYRDVMRECIIYNDWRMEALMSVVKQHKDEVILIICKTIEFVEIVAENLNCPYVTGQTDLKLRKKFFKKFREGKIPCLVASGIYDEGVDFPALDVLILAEPYSSLIKLIQRVGRVMRVRENKVVGIVYDFWDKNIPFFEAQAKRRYKMYKTVFKKPKTIIFEGGCYKDE